MTQTKFELPNKIHDIGSLVVRIKEWSSKPSVEDLWMAYLLARVPAERMMKFRLFSHGSIKRLRSRGMSSCSCSPLFD